MRSRWGALAVGVGVLLSCLAASAGDGDHLQRVILEDFERESADDDWSTRQVELSLFERQDSDTGSSRAARLVYPRWARFRGKWPAAILEQGDGQFLTTDWSLYSTLRFKARALHPRVVHLKLRIDDGDGRRAIRIVPIKPHLASSPWTECEISLAGLVGEIDTRDVRGVDFYMSQPAADYVIEIDDLRLEAAVVTVEQAELTTDPFDAGSLEVEAGFNKRVPWRVVVADTAGVAAAVYSGNGLKVHLRESLPVSVPAAHDVTLEAVGHDGSSVTRFLGSLSPHGPGGGFPIVAWVEPSTQKVLLRDLPSSGEPVFRPGEASPTSASPFRLDMAQGEIEAFQVVLRTKNVAATARVTVDVIEHVDGNAAFSDDAVSVSRVLYVDAQEPEEYAVDYSGWWPDPLVSANRFIVEPGENAPLWMALESVVDQLPGLYRGQIQVQTDPIYDGGQTEVLRIPFEVRVYPVAMPTATTMQTAFSFYESSLSQFYGEEGAARMLPRYRDFIADHRLNVTNIYTGTSPDPQQLAALREGGQLNRFVALYLESGEYDTEQLEEIAEVFDPYVAEYRRLGLMPQALLYGFDEAGVAEFADLKATFAFFKQRYPDLHTATTAADPSLGMDTGLDDVVDVWIPLTAYHDPVTAAEARAAGAEVWWYTCIAPTRPHANWFIEYPALEARLLWWMSYRQRVDGYLYYTLNRWPGNSQPLQPPRLGNKVRSWNPASLGTANGDGCLLYPGPDSPLTSIRLENVRDGLEDLELLRILAAQDAGVADELCDRVAGPGITGFSRDPDEFARTRKQLLESLAQLSVRDMLRLDGAGD